ncbi:hypothetical protein BU26DRAFT_412062 [Trematosphaeria pertusa]|uniref:Uncharacterized protein n=1 Tax=Trematosphaeria pertusa TaxID=390896 RepID=A0A6A6J1W2_9PLEO|nr:uncharacterized protein BU26DRAFT_412062 [Trematosphaeria pertusa]KAF2256182.1 hypothetical protein BU26DRAFT_412062 [Trematosphaeria pertusa]
MFALERWTKGPDQQTRSTYNNMRHVLRLASRLLTEDCSLDFFAHLTCGERKQDRSFNPPRTYIATTRYERTREARDEVRTLFRELGEVVSFVFAPRGYPIQAYGLTYAAKEETPFIKTIRPGDWPPIDRRYRTREYDGRCWPCVILSPDILHFFDQGYEQASPSMTYKIAFLAAVTIAHECVHAYDFWLGESNKEPYFNRGDKKAELGYAWELQTFGRIINPLWNQIQGCTLLLSILTEEYIYREDRQAALKKVADRTHISSRSQFRRLELDQAAWDRLDPRDIRGGEWFCESSSQSGMSYVCAVHAIPMAWIINWWQEDHWEKMRRDYRHRGTYEPPRLGKTFMLFYQRNSDGASVHYPLNPSIAADAYEIQCYEEFERGRDKHSLYDHRAGRIL